MLEFEDEFLSIGERLKTLPEIPAVKFYEFDFEDEDPTLLADCPFDVARNAETEETKRAIIEFFNTSTSE